jgi:glycosyltransferase involved in cell wall biosynthesis
MKKFVLMMTSDFTYDQRMNRIYDVISQDNDIVIYHRNEKSIKTIFSSGFLFYLEFNLRLFTKLIFNRYDVVYAVDTDTLVAAGFASWFKKFYLIYDSHEYFIGVPELQDQMIKKFIWKTVENWFVKKTHLCLTVNDSLAQILSDEFQTRFYSIRNVPYLSIDVEKDKGTNPYFIYQGALNEGRGIEELIEVMKLFKQYHLYIVGDGDLKMKLQEVARKFNLDNIVFTGKKLPSEIKEITSSALIGFNLLSKYSQSYYFSAANKCFDYINALIPSINMAFPEYLSINEKYGIGECIQNVDIKTITFAIEKILDTNNYSSYVDGCKRAREEYNWENESKKLKNLLDLHIK